MNRRLPAPAQVAANLGLTVSTVADHLLDDPVVLALQVMRRLPPRARTAAADALAGAGGGPLAVLTALGHAAAGRPAELGALVRSRVGQASPVERVHLADVLTAAQEPELADELLSGTPSGTRGWSEARARWHWHHGQVDEAIAVLTTRGRPGRLRARFDSEHRALTGGLTLLSGRDVKRAVGYEPTPRRVLHVLTNSLPHTGSGYAQRSHSLLLATRGAGWDPEAVTRLGWPVQTGVLHARSADEVDGVLYHRLLTPRLQPGMDHRLAQHARLLLDLVLDRRPAVLHTTTHWVNAVVTRAVAEAVGIPWVYEVRGQLADTWASTRGPEAKRSQRYRLFQAREAEAVRSADGVVTLGEQMARRIAADGVPRGEIVLSPNAVGGAFLQTPRDAHQARRELGLDAAAEYIGTVSSIVPYEGLDDLLRAAAILAPRRPRLRVLLVGDGTDLPRLRQLAVELGIDDRLVTTGRVDRSLAPLYHRALDVFCVPRKDKDVTRSVTPMKPLEAMASERPTLVSALPALREIVTDGVTGITVPPEDPAAWAGALESVLSDPEWARSLGQAARAWVVAERTWGSNAERYAALYARLGAAESRPNEPSATGRPYTRGE